MSILPEDAKERKTFPLYSGCLAYFPDALLMVAKNSFDGNEQHHPGTPLHWDRSKSQDELDALCRHLVDEEWDKVAWRALANLQRKIDAGWRPENKDMVVIADGTDQPRVKITYKQALEQIASKNDPPEVKAGLPKLPDGWVYYGVGLRSNDGWHAHRDDTGYWGQLTSKWFLGNGAASGQCPEYHYALRRGSEIAKLNGLE